MQLTPSYDQQTAIEWGLNQSQATILQFLMYCPAWADIKIINGERYFWISRYKLAEEFPLLTSDPNTMYRHLKKLAEKGVIKYCLDGKRDMVHIPKSRSEVWGKSRANGEKISPNSEKNTCKRGNISGKRSEKIPTDQNTNNNQTTSNKTYTREKFEQLYESMPNKNNRWKAEQEWLRATKGRSRVEISEIYEKTVAVIDKNRAKWLGCLASPTEAHFAKTLGGLILAKPWLDADTPTPEKTTDFDTSWAFDDYQDNENENGGSETTVYTQEGIVYELERSTAGVNFERRAP